MSLIKKPHEIQGRKTMRALVYGQPGIGKTTLALSCPKPLLIDCDGGIGRVREDFWRDAVQVQSYDDVINVLKEDLSAYETIIFDTVGKLLDYMVPYLIKLDAKNGGFSGMLSIKGYGSRKNLFVNLVNQLSILGKHIIFIAHETEDKDGDVKIVRPAIGGSSLGDLIKEIDLVGYFCSKNNKPIISFDACEKFYAKNTCQLQSDIQIPSKKIGEENNFFGTIISQFHDQLNRRADTVKKYTELATSIDDQLGLVVDVDTANGFCDYVKTASHIWDSKLYALSKIKQRAKDLGLSVEKATSKYVKNV